MLDGYEVCRCLKADEELKQIPVILLTDSTAGEIAGKVKEFKVDDYLVKPFEPEELLEKVKKFIGEEVCVHMQKKILIVDDEKDVLEVLERRLSDAGHLVLKAENGKDAIVMAKNQHPDLIMLDIIMPNIDGAEAADILQSDPETKDIPIIFLTCLLTKEEEKGRRTISGRYFIAKPYNPEELLEVVEKHINP